MSSASKTYNVDPKLWAKVNLALRDSNPGTAIATMLNGMCAILVATGGADDLDEARVILAAMVLSPADRRIGSLADRVPDALAKLRGDRWLM